MAPRNEEAERAAIRLDSIMDQLMAATEPDADQPDYGDLARQLFPVARMFESSGFMSVAREVAYVEKALNDLAPESAVSTPAPRPDETWAEEADMAGGLPLERAARADDQEPAPIRERFRIPSPMGIMLLVLLLAILGSILIVRHRRDIKRRRAAAAATPVATQTARPTPSPFPTSTETTAPPTPSRRSLAADEVARSRLALSQGDLDGAISHLWAAARLDFSSSAVLETAKNIVNRLISDADGAAAGARFDDAARLLELAREISLRFGFSVQPIDVAAHRHATMVRYEILGPRDVAALRAATGKRAVVYLEGGRIEEGRIHGVSGDNLELDQSTDVGDQRRGGRLYYVEPIPLAVISEIKVFEE
jgi:hypothetical protein